MTFTKDVLQREKVRKIHFSGLMTERKMEKLKHAFSYGRDYEIIFHLGTTIPMRRSLCPRARTLRHSIDKHIEICMHALL